METTNELLEIGALQPHPRNYNRHPAEQVRKLAKSLRKMGQVRSIVVWRGTILAGHGVVEAAKSLKWKTIRADVLPDEYPEELALAYVAADNELARQGDPDLAQLLGILEESRAADEELLEAMGFDADEFAALLADVGGGTKTGELVDAEPQIDRAEELRTKWSVETGQLWQLGDHRLICGDCTDKAVVERVMGGEKIRCVWTDPPYGVSYADKNEFLNALDRGNRNQTPIEHDHMNAEDTQKLTTDALRLAVANADIAASCYVACPPGTLLPHFIAAVADSGFGYKHSLVWVKNQFVLGRCDYHYKHEVILYGWIENGAHYFVDDHTKCSVIEVDKPRSSAEHPTMKPVELVTAMIENSTRKTDIVYEPFSGSGTTLIACEQLGRRCRAAEISPGYVAVALERWATATGKVPIMLD